MNKMVLLTFDSTLSLMWMLVLLSAFHFDIATKMTLKIQIS